MDRVGWFLRGVGMCLGYALVGAGILCVVVLQGLCEEAGKRSWGKGR